MPTDAQLGLYQNSGIVLLNSRGIETDPVVNNVRGIFWIVVLLKVSLLEDPIFSYFAANFLLKCLDI